MRLLACLALVALAAAEEFEVAPRELAWDEVDARAFELRRRLPAPPPGAPDLLPRLEELLALRFGSATEDGPTCFGDLARELAAVAPEARRAHLERALEGASGVPAELREAFAQLLLDDRLRSRRWDPDDDHARDGVLHGPGFELRDAGPPWSDVGKRLRLEQGAVFLRADVAAFKEVENDYRPYLEHRKNDYEWIRPVEGHHFRGSDPEGRPFAVSRIVLRADLPFPFGGYDCDLHILNRTDGAGRLVADVYSTSPDFHWLAGRDVFLHVAAADGEPVGTLVLRTHGFDLDGVPDRPKHRRAALRSGLCSLKLRAEALQAERRAEWAAPGRVPPFRVLGRR